MKNSIKRPDSSDIQEKMRTQQFDAALQDIDVLLAEDPQHGEALYMAAVCYRYKKEYRQAQGCLDSLKSLSSDKGRTYQEQGHLYRAQNLLPQALAAFESACQLNSALVASWRSMNELALALGREAEARQAQVQYQRLQKLPQALVGVTDLIAQGKLYKAETLCRRYLKKVPTDTEGMRLLADIAVRFGVLEDAEFLLESAVEFAPENIQLKIDFVAVLRKQQKFTQALSMAEQLYQRDQQNPQLQSIYAIEKMQMGDYAGAVEMFDQVLKTLPNDAVTLASKGHALKTWGKQSDAIQCYRLAIKHHPEHGDAYYSLSNLKVYQFEADEINVMLELEQRDELHPMNRVHLCFALGKAFEDAEDYSRSFHFYEKGNYLKRQQSNYDASKMSEELMTQCDYFSAEVFTGRQNAGCQKPDPIFIVGLPRAGSTLLEQILSSHSQVDGTLELPNMLSMAQKLRRLGREDSSKPYPDLLSDLTDAQLCELGEQYIDETRIHRQAAPFFIDKMPNNFRHIGLIKLVLPNAKIIDARRDPMACCFSGFKQLFAEGQEFTYSISDIAQYYNDYVRLMSHWDKVIPGSVIRVQYEDVVDNIEQQVRRILDYCQLPFESQCLDFYKTERAVRTASSEQVRQPIYQSGIGQWTHFQSHLGELESALEKSAY